MRKIVLIYYILKECYIITTFGQDATYLVPILNDTLDDDDLNLPPDLNNSSVLRTGHRIHECEDFKKAYVCIMKCLELGYHIAESNKKCTCTCYKDYVKGKYFGGVKSGWKVPTTSLPPWAVQIDDESDIEKITDTIEIESDTNTLSIENNATDIEEGGKSGGEGEPDGEAEAEEEGEPDGEAEAEEEGEPDGEAEAEEEGEAEEKQEGEPEEVENESEEEHEEAEGESSENKEEKTEEVESE